MTIIKAFKTRIYPTNEQKEHINATLNCCRFIYNYMLARNIKIYKRRKEHLSYYQMQNLLPVMKTYLSWLRRADSQALKYACRQLADAYKRFFKKQGGFPVFKKKHGRQSYTTTNVKQMGWAPGQIKIPCLGYVRTKDKRSLPANAKLRSITISMEPDGSYYASLTYKYEQTVIMRPITEKDTVGLDYNVSTLFVTDRGDCELFPVWYQEALKKLAMEQRKLARKVGSKKGERKSKRYLKQLQKVNRLYAKIARQRQDYLHKKSTLITKAYSTVCTEDLSMKDLMTKAKSQPRKIRKHINHAYANNGWYKFTQLLEYKAQYQGGRVVKIDKYFKSSQTCSICGHENPEVKDLNVRAWKCPACGEIHNRDINAAKNIKTEGLRMLLAS